MAHETAKDYLGHPCKFTEAKTYFAEPFDNSQALEYRQIKRSVGSMLLDLNARVTHALNASRAICDMVRSSDEADELHALLVMRAEYEVRTSDLFFTFAGLVLAGFEDGPSNTKVRA